MAMSAALYTARYTGAPSLHRGRESRHLPKPQSQSIGVNKKKVDDIVSPVKSEIAHSLLIFSFDSMIFFLKKMDPQMWRQPLNLLHTCSAVDLNSAPLAHDVSNSPE